ncbi:MAG: lipopolysaccharide biosynthesis protein, partial [Steroidobacteraceae bacterium]|nr:lipopolysaccharide biosynthesis protein [Steroidobacteraceae bacterium]
MVADAVGSVIGLLASPVTTRLLSPEQYGAAALVAAIWSLVATASFGGMDSAFPYFRANRPAMRDRVVVTATVVGSAGAVMCCAIFAGATALVPYVREFVGVSALELAVFSAGLVPGTLVTWCLLLLRYEHRAAAFARVSVFARAFGTVAALPLMALVAPESRLMVFWATAGVVCAVAFGVAILELDRAGCRLFALSAYDGALAREMLRYGAFLVPAGALYGLLAVLDRLIVGWFLGPAQAAVFALALSLGSITMLAKAWFARAFDPYLVQWVAERDAAALLARLQKAIRAVLTILGPAPLLAAIWAEPFVRVLYLDAYADAACLIPIFCFAGVVSTLSLIAVATA